jgi:predicted 3-demethylubiquinone-9 3-methyltransferase (glyoxalase superfamily)
MNKITPFLWYDGKAAEAAKFYTSLFKNSRIVSPAVLSDNGSEMSVTFEIDGQQLIAFNGGPHFTFTPAISLFINCDGQAEVDELWEKLSEGGEKSRCGWLKDKYGVSWQVIPAGIGNLLQGNNPAAAQRAMKAMMQMSKIDLAVMQKAYDGE